jgi:antirestriction protein ArdC
MAARTTTRTDRPDVYKTVTDSIIAALEAGNVAPWHKPWQAGHAAGPVSRPLRHNGQPYQGVNVLVLWIAAEAKGYTAPLWLTFKQAQELGGNGRRGEKGTTVVYASTFTKEETRADGSTAERKIPFLKTYTVFNAEQCDGLPAHYTAQLPPPAGDVKPHETAAAFAAATGADIRAGGARAYYSPSGDYIQVPHAAAFETAEAHACTTLHELAHWTGHASRLDRDLAGKFERHAYAAEELVAELAAAFLAADLGLEASPHPEHVNYLAAWLEVLKNDKRAIFTAASAASRAAAYLHSLQPGGAGDQEPAETETETVDA